MSAQASSDETERPEAVPEAVQVFDDGVDVDVATGPVLEVLGDAGAQAGELLPKRALGRRSSPGISKPFAKLGHREAAVVFRSLPVCQVLSPPLDKKAQDEKQPGCSLPKIQGSSAPVTGGRSS